MAEAKEEDVASPIPAVAEGSLRLVNQRKRSNTQVRNQLGQFDRCANPGPGAVHSGNATAVHGIIESDPHIKNAQGIVDVWKDFITFVKGHLDGGNKKNIITAWGGKSGDLQKEQRGTLHPTPGMHKAKKG